MEKTYIFDSNSGSNFDHSALLASLMNNKSMDPGLLALMQNASNNQDAWRSS